MSKTKRRYYWESPLEFAVDKYLSKQHNQKILISDISAQIEKKLKEDSIFLETVTVEMEKDNLERKLVKQKANAAVSKEKKEQQAINWQQATLLDRKENPEKWEQIHEDIANTLRENGTYERNAISWREKRMQETPEERSALSRYANECMTPEIREQIRLSNIKTNNKNKLDNFTKNYYDVIQEAGWFSREEAHAKYQFKGRTRGTVLGDQMLGVAFSDCVKLGLFKSKYMQVVTLSGGARRMYYTKVVEGKDIDLKSLKDKVNLENEKVRALRLTDEDHLAKRAKTKLKIEKKTAIKNKKRMDEYLAKLPKTGITFDMIKNACPNHGWYGKVISNLEFENQAIGRTGMQITRKCIWKKTLK